MGAPIRTSLVAAAAFVTGVASLACGLLALVTQFDQFLLGVVVLGVLDLRAGNLRLDRGEAVAPRPPRKDPRRLGLFYPTRRARPSASCSCRSPKVCVKRPPVWRP